MQLKDFVQRRIIAILYYAKEDKARAEEMMDDLFVYLADNCPDVIDELIFDLV